MTFSSSLFSTNVMTAHTRTRYKNRKCMHISLSCNEVNVRMKWKFTNEYFNYDMFHFFVTISGRLPLRCCSKKTEWKKWIFKVHCYCNSNPVNRIYFHDENVKTNKYRLHLLHLIIYFYPQKTENFLLIATTKLSLNNQSHKWCRIVYH